MMLSTERHIMLLRICAAICVIFSLTQTIYAAWISSETLDEPFHLGWNRRFVDEGISERESVYNYISTTPILVLNVHFQRAVQAITGGSRQFTLFLTRLLNVTWLLGIMFASFLLAKWAGGLAAAYLALIGVSLDPNIIAHSSLATVDASYTFGFLATLAALIWHGRKRTFVSTVMVGVALGFTLVAKFTGLFLAVAIVSLPLTFARLPRLDWKSLFQTILEIAVVLTVTSVVICIGYQFHEVGFRFSDVRFYNRIFRGLAIALPNLQPPLPFDFVSGIDHLLEAGARESWNVIFMGQWYQQGIWSYFIVAWLLKTPLILLLAQVSAFILIFRSLDIVKKPLIRFLAFNLFFFVFYFSFMFRMQVGYRYILMCVPLLYIIAACGLTRIRAVRATPWLPVLAICITMVEVGWYFGNPIAFTNFAFWPKKNAFRVLADSNIDWGQNRWRLRDILKEYGVETTHEEPLHILPGHNTFGLNVLAGVFWNFEQHRWVRENLEPAGHYRHTFLWYDVSQDDFSSFLRDERTLSSAANLKDCQKTGDLTVLTQKISLSFPAARAKTLCIKASSAAKIRFYNRMGEAKFGPLRNGWQCNTEMVYQEKESWYVLEPGTHEFCVEATRASTFEIEPIDNQIEYWMVG